MPIPAGVPNFSVLPNDPTRIGMIVKNRIGGSQARISFGTTSDQGVTLAAGEALPQFQDGAVPTDEIFADSAAGTVLEFVITYRTGV